MSLRVRLALLLLLIFVLIFGLGAIMVIHNARAAVHEETRSTAHLTLSLLELAFSNISQSRHSDLQVILAGRVTELERTRHLQIHVVDRSGRLITHQFSPESKVQTDAPAWFVALVQPDEEEFRRVLPDNGGPYKEILIKADPSDEISEAWIDARLLLGLMLLSIVLVSSLFFFLLGRWLRPVDSILIALEGIEQGKLDARLPAIDLPELRQIADKFNLMAATLEQTSQSNRQLAERSLVIQEEERRHLAQELHDELGQSISAIKAVAVSIRQRTGDTLPDVADNAETINGISSHIYAVVKGMMQRLRPVILDELGLLPALQEMVDQWNMHHGEMFCVLTVNGDLDQLDDVSRINIYRIVQEALTNIAKHARAEQVSVQLNRVNGDDTVEELQLQIEDDGIGFDPLTARRGLGLLGMQERTEILKGKFSLVSRPGGGVRLNISLPIAAIGKATDEYTSLTG